LKTIELFSQQDRPNNLKIITDGAIVLITVGPHNKGKHAAAINVEVGTSEYAQIKDWIIEGQATKQVHVTRVIKC
jgi:hypothetical protein